MSFTSTGTNFTSSYTVQNNILTLVPALYPYPCSPEQILCCFVTEYVRAVNFTVPPSRYHAGTGIKSTAQIRTIIITFTRFFISFTRKFLPTEQIKRIIIHYKTNSHSTPESLRILWLSISYQLISYKCIISSLALREVPGR